MRSPDGEEHENVGCYLEIVQRKLLWTDALEPGFRPARRPPPLSLRFAAVIALDPRGAGTRYTATVLHQDEESRAKHEAMGFAEGWGKALEQFVAYMTAVAAR